MSNRNQADLVRAGSVMGLFILLTKLCTKDGKAVQWASALARSDKGPRQ